MCRERCDLYMTATASRSTMPGEAPGTPEEMTTFKDALVAVMEETR